MVMARNGVAAGSSGAAWRERRQADALRCMVMQRNSCDRLLLSSSKNLLISRLAAIATTTPPWHNSGAARGSSIMATVWRGKAVKQA